jgi:hypothetical protein
MLFDNGVNSGGWAQIQSGAGGITFGAGINNNLTGFTASGLKGLATGWTVSYMLV